MHSRTVPERYLAPPPRGQRRHAALIEHQMGVHRCPLSQAEQWHAVPIKYGVSTELPRASNKGRNLPRNDSPCYHGERL